MRKGLRFLGTAAFSLATAPFAAAQFTLPIPPPGTPVAELDVPAHVLPAPVSSAPVNRVERSINRRIINTTNAQIDYRIGTVGPSGVGRVDIYLTPDRGATWVKAGEDADKQSPAQIDLPGEGLFGVRIAIMNGNGFGGRAPKAGDLPQMYVEVDAASPKVTLQQSEMVPNMAAVDLRWTAVDANMAADPISLFYRTPNDTDWRAIAHNIKNTGSHRWMLPRDIPASVYLKIEAIDLAGNATKIEVPTPILLDQTEPEATIVDATPLRKTQNPVQPVSMPALPSTTIAPPPVILPSSLPALPTTLRSE